MADFAQTWGIAAKNLGNFDQTYLDTAIAAGTDGTGCFGLRAMWENIAPLCKRLGVFYPGAQDDRARLHAAFGPLRFIHLSRNDKVAEAVSLAMAAQTGLWHRNADGSELERLAPPQDPVYDQNLIAAEYTEVTQGDAAWRTWFAAHHISPLELSYEDLSADPQGNLAKALAFIGVDPSHAKGILPGTAKLATELSTEWARRFRADAGIATHAQPT